jgi:hypothetical protein
MHIDNDLTPLSKEELMPDLPNLVSEADFESMCAALDGLLLLQNKPIGLEKLAEILNTNIQTVEKVVLSRKSDFDNDEKSGLQIAILETGVQLATKAKVSQFNPAHGRTKVGFFVFAGS